MRLRLLVLLLFTTALPACERDGGEPEVAVADTPGEPNGAPALSAAQPAEEEPEYEPPRQIYYDLTQHDWYRLGQPLRVEGASYTLGGVPVRGRTTDFELAGTYEGVDYYRARDGAAAAVYVPVFEGFWQPFTRGGGAPVD